MKPHTTRALAALAYVLLASPALAAWEVVHNVPTTVDLHDVATGANNAVVAVGDGGTILRSTDLGATWSLVNGPSSQDLISVNFAGSHYRAGGAGGHAPQSFDNGITWQFFGGNPPGTSPELFSTATSVSYAATAEGGLFLTTNAGNNWQQLISPTGTAFRGGSGTANSPGLVVGDGGVIWHTVDGVNWSPVSSGTSADLLACEGPNVYSVVVGQGGTIRKSDEDALDWSPRESGTSVDLNAFDRFGTSHALAVGNNGVILWSTDSCETWCPLSSGTSENLRGVDFAGLIAIAVGDNGTIVRHTGDYGPCDGTSSVDSGPGGRPGSNAPSPAALRVAPNPAVAGTTLLLSRADGSGDEPVARLLQVVDVTGRPVRSLAGAWTPASAIPLDTRGLPAGVYWVRVQGDRFSARQKLMIVK